MDASGDCEKMGVTHAVAEMLWEVVEECG
jgi:hypothetical protein